MDTDVILVLSQLINDLNCIRNTSMYCWLHEALIYRDLYKVIDDHSNTISNMLQMAINDCLRKLDLCLMWYSKNILKAIKTWQNKNLSITKQRIFRHFQAINSRVNFWNITLQVRRFAVNQADFHRTLMVAFKKMIDCSFNKASVSHQNARANNPKYGAGARRFINSVISPIVPIPPINFG